MKKAILVMAALVFGLCSFAQQKGMVIIKGTITGDLNGYNKVYMYTHTDNDSATIKDGHYTFTFPFKGVDMKFFVPEYAMRGNMSYRPFGMLIDKPGTYYIITDKAKGMENSEIKGSEAAVLFQNFGKEQDEAYSKVNKVMGSLYGQNWWMIVEDPNDPRNAALQKSQDSLHTIYMLPLMEALVKNHPNSAASTFVLASEGEGTGSLQEKEHLYSLLSPEMKKSKEGQQFYDYIEGVKNSNIGNEVKNFSLPDPEGKLIDFAKFKGKYVLVDFWASWCVPCRQSFPKMRKIYAYYKDKGFEIYSISIDQSKEAWLKAVKEDKNPWTQALDTKNIAKKGFAVTAVPTAYLVNPEGKIIAKQVGFDPGTAEGPVENKLDELWGKIQDTQDPTEEPPAQEHDTIKMTPAAKMQ